MTTSRLGAVYVPLGCPPLASNDTIPRFGGTSVSGSNVVTLPGTSPDTTEVSGPGDLLIAFRAAIGTTPDPAGWVAHITGMYAMYSRVRQLGDTTVTFTPPSGGCRALVASIRNGTALIAALHGGGGPSISISGTVTGNVLVGCLFWSTSAGGGPSPTPAANIASSTGGAGGVANMTMFARILTGAYTQDYNPFPISSPLTMHVIDTLDARSC